MLALEVLWTRMFSLVLENSVYTFAAILVVVLSCLAGGSLISSVLARRKWSPNTVLAVLLGLSGVDDCHDAHCFHAVDRFIQVSGGQGGLGGFRVFDFQEMRADDWSAGLVLGAVFPYLMKAEERYATSPGRSLGRLATINTIGAILGSLVCAFLFLERFGMWRSMQIIGVIYFLMAVWMLIGSGTAWE